MQPKKSTKIDNQKGSTFGDRLKIAFGTDETAEIARKIGGTYQQVKNYLEGRLPKAEVLIQIRESTNVDLNWLLMGGSESIAPANLNRTIPFDEEELAAIDKIAESADDNFESIIAMIVREWLFERGQLASIEDKEILAPVYAMNEDLPQEKRHEIIGRMIERTLKLAAA